MDHTTRRSFIVQGTAFAGALATTKTTLAGTVDGDLITRMTWFNEPAASKRVGEKLIVRSRPKTDFWRKTFLRPGWADGPRECRKLDEVRH